ncbi:hypothetical protein [Bradyrhizobium sp. CCGUVB23]|uniref:hypothetical protein n=1 Tax=Bradyrhizobium sp. CCGUVB23 TaxID=2949630 RepID=UPI0020B31F8E|nr:hypothetical protein [Bradyrhizobium sp. CCGUVB23]MCP3468697.1 hypothetical protein [Bradyrhizobium sp. CCGUVB23]
MDAIDQRHQLAMVARARRQPVCNDDLRFAIDGRLRVITLDEAVFGFENAAFRIGEVALGLCGRLVGWRRGGLAGLLATLSLAALLLLGLDATLLVGRGLGLRLQFSLGRSDPGDPLLLVGDPVGQFVATFGAVQPVVFGRLLAGPRAPAFTRCRCNNTMHARC